MSDPPRRTRRASGTGSVPPRSNGGFPLVPAIVAVILVGLFIGAALAHIIAGGHTTTVTAQSNAPAPSPTPEPSTTPQRQPTLPRATLAAPRAPQHTATAPVATTPAEVATASAAAAAPARATPRTAPPVVSRPAIAVPRATVRPIVRTAAPVAGVTGGVSAEAVASAYSGALAAGRPQTAAAYLDGGSVDADSFLDASAEISSMSSSRNADGSYGVRARVQTASGPYAMTFTIRGGRIVEHVGVHF